MKKTSLFLFLFSCLVLSLQVTACSVPADPTPHTMIQPNGKTITFILRGDENLHWYESLDGYTLLRNQDQYLEFACIDENQMLIPSGILACNQDQRDEQELDFLQTIEPRLFFSDKQIELKKQARSRTQKQ